LSFSATSSSLTYSLSLHDALPISTRLAYKFDIYATAPLYRADVYVDAKTGQFIMENKKIHHANVPATGTSLYNGTVSFTADNARSEEHTSELQSRENLVCRLLLEK